MTARIVFECDKCEQDGRSGNRLELDVTQLCIIDSAYEHVRELGWTFGPMNGVEDEAVICPNCGVRS